MFDNFAELEGSIQQKIEADTDFQATLADLSEEDKTTAMTTKKSELLDSELKTFSEKSKKNEELANNYKTRAEKAEKDAKTAKPVESELTVKDGMILATAGVHPEDIDEVVKAAKLLGKSIPEALKDNVVKNILNEKAEIRKSAEIANSKPRQQGQQKPSDDAIVKDTFENDKIPEKGSSAAEQLFWAKRGGKR